MIFIGIGANLPSERFGNPLETCEAALKALDGAGVRVLRRARWYKSAPVPLSDQPWFINGIAEIETELTSTEVLARLHAIEAGFGRVRGVRNAARVLDLDLIAYGDEVADGAGGGGTVPHPRMAERAFVLLPLAELAPGWRHPATGTGIAELVAALPPGQVAEPL